MRYIFTIALFFLMLTFLGQDIHFSQSHLSPVNLNPAETGNYTEDYRFHLNQRTQWRSITIPYITFSASFEINWFSLHIPGKLATGLIFNTDKAGDGRFGTNQIGIAPSYTLPIKDSSLSVSVALIGMWNQHSVDYSKFYFDNQYNGYMFDPNIPPSEIFPRQSMHYYDAHAGLLVRKQLEKFPVTMGISLYHINKPKKTFYNDFEVKLDRKFTLYLNSNMQVARQIFFIPHVYWFQQYMLREIYLGGLLHHKTQDIAFRGYYIGGWFRIGDAAILSAAFDYQDFHIAISYDFNISPLVAASNGRGGLEIAIRYVLSKPEKIILPDKHRCPSFL